MVDTGWQDFHRNCASKGVVGFVSGPFQRLATVYMQDSSDHTKLICFPNDLCNHFCYIYLLGVEYK